ncbi:Signal transduction histidine kinase [Methylomagnum ishizawai]|uniref:histidine kinase n=1 Tax=Methylomagnum ishizawai TaxID=1760988 RepID=A0A1Y6D7R3_9GAMM|nr:ATP-binding protein [Methylomagnum ishizawai]SMF95875.1 Signal transduction histidine kinase [Methylomagnum ishizawai]
MTQQSGPDQPLSDRAQALWCQRPRESRSDADGRKLLQELEIHQIELELQNEELRLARAEAEAALARYTDLYDFAPIAYFTLDPTGAILRANFAGARLLGTERAHLMGKRFGLWVESPDRPALADFLTRAFATPGTAACEVALISRGAGPTLIRLGTSRDGPNRECRVVAEDITARELARQALEAAHAAAHEANQAKSRFLAAASHDLRQPLLALGLYIDGLAAKLGPREAANLDKMKSCLSGLGDLLSSLLELGKLEAGAVRTQCGDFSLDDMLRQSVMAQAPNADAKGIALRHRPTRLTGHTDAALFRRMLGNLIANAVRYTARGGVLVGCRRRRDKVWVEVWDTGVGLSQDQIPAVFEEFRQLGNPGRNPEKGHGLGLSIVAKTAALLGVRVRVQSRPGVGSLFALELPLGGTLQPAKESAPACRALRIALVDDNADVRESFTFALEAEGHRVVAAADGAELLARLANGPPEVLVADYQLAGEETGVDVIRSVRAAFGVQVPALILTGDTDPRSILGLGEMGIPIQHKPIELDDLMVRIAELVAGTG